MEIGAVIERVERIAAVHANAAADCELIEAGLVAVREVTAWAGAAQQAALVRQLASKTSFPEATIAKTAKISVGQAAKSKESCRHLGPNAESGGPVG